MCAGMSLNWKEGELHIFGETYKKNMLEKLGEGGGGLLLLLL